MTVFTLFLILNILIILRGNALTLDHLKEMDATQSARITICSQTALKAYSLALELQAHSERNLIDGIAVIDLKLEGDNNVHSPNQEE